MADAHRGSRKTIDVLARAAVIYAVLLEESEASRDELIARVRKELGPTAYGKAPEDSLRHDLDWLERLGFEVGVFAGHRYRLVDIAPRFPLPISREHVEMLATVRKALEGTLYGGAIEDFVKRLRPFVDPNLRPQLDREPLLKLNVPLLDDLAPHQSTLHQIRRAYYQRRRISFLYTSPARPEARPIRHTVEPEALEESDGHVYFEGYSVSDEDVLPFRLDRVVPGSVEVLPTRFVGGRQRRAIPIRYRLAPKIARSGATRRFDEHDETVLPDGWIEVTAKTKSLFWASKKLLKYGENCIVVEPPELVAEMKRVVGEMARNYGLEV
ncbi:MAG TPA: WYL domain-containing protein [Anaerolineae bacterium]|nr:WYL domain-containing protein [Pyrinomonadaceae bacterium]HKZ87262.1 WYL domain-containing protein [Anaerolineae bacterium]